MKLIEIAGRHKDEEQSPGHKVDLLTQSEKAKSSEQTIQFIRNKLNTDCKEILAIYKKLNPDIESIPSTDKLKVMWRGEGTEARFFKNSIWTKRKPLWMDAVAHEAYQVASKNLGLMADRENAIFCGRENAASDWGRGLYIIFPVDGYEVTWFEKSLGLYMFDEISQSLLAFADDYATEKDIYYQEAMLKLSKKYSKFDQAVFDQYVKKVEQLIKSSHPRNGDLSDALTNPKVTEYLVTGNAYYGLSSEMLARSKLLKTILS